MYDELADVNKACCSKEHSRRVIIPKLCFCRIQTRKGESVEARPTLDGTLWLGRGGTA
jgi:hypothetical protein